MESAWSYCIGLDTGGFCLLRFENNDIGRMLMRFLVFITLPGFFCFNSIMAMVMAMVMAFFMLMMTPGQYDGAGHSYEK